MAKQAYSNITCSKCGNTVSGVYCPMCGAKLLDIHAQLYNRMSRDGGKWAREKHEDGAYGIGTRCFEMARNAQSQKYPGKRLKEICTSEDVEDIMNLSQRLYDVIIQAMQ